jgi:hypothetical protein
LQFTYVQATGEASALKIEHPAFQKMKFINFFLCLWVIFALLDPDLIQIHSTAKNYAILSGSLYSLHADKCLGWWKLTSESLVGQIESAIIQKGSREQHLLVHLR